MSPRLSMAIAAAVAAAGCGPVGGTEGKLGHGAFSYQCGGPSDVVCDPTLGTDTEDAVQYESNEWGTPLPGGVAVAGWFGITYAGDRPEAESGAALEVAVVPASPQMVTDLSGKLAFTQPGVVSFLAQGADGTVADFVDLRAEHVQSVELWSGGQRVSGLELAATGGSAPAEASVIAVPLDWSSWALAGALAYAWTSADPAVADVQCCSGSSGTVPTTHRAFVRAKGQGKTTISVTAGGRTGTLEVTVE